MYQEITAFNNLDEYRLFLEKIDNDQDLVQIEVESPYANVGLIEKWYKSKTTGEIWRLIEPDFPFRGTWGKVR